MRKTVLLLATMSAALMLASVVALVAVDEQAHAAFPGINGKIAFVSDRDIYTKNHRGDNVRRITDAPGLDNMPSWSADGRKIVFVHTNPFSSISTINTVNADGTGNKEVITRDLGAYNVTPAFSPSGKKIVFAMLGLGTDGLYIVNADGSNSSNPTQLTTGPTSGDSLELDAAPAWSPDGKKIAFSRSTFDTQTQTSSTSLYIINLADLSLELVVGSDLQTQVWNPDWSPDGTQITYECYYLVGESNSQRNAEICRVNADGTDVRRLTSNPANDVTPAFSPDGGKIAFASDRGGNRNLYIMNTDGTDVRQLTSNLTTVEQEPSWQPLPKPPPTERCTISGTNGRDVLHGTKEKDVICGRDGPDAIEGREGNDILRGGAGSDAIVGGAGADDLYGQKGFDSLNSRDGVEGNDAMDGGGGTDACLGDRSDTKSGCEAGA